MTSAQPTKPEFKPVDALYGLGCLGILAYVFFGVANLVSGPGRSESLPPVVRATTTSEEKAVRDQIESFSRSAVFTSTRDRSKETDPLQRFGPEPRPGVSLFHFCNLSDGDRVVLLDGVEIFQFEVPANASVGVELRSGAYDLMIVGKIGQQTGEPVVVVPTYRRVQFDATCHAVLAGAGNCSGRHKPPIRTVK